MIIEKIKIGMNVIKNFKNWYMYYLDWAKLVNKKYIIFELRNGIKFKARPCTTDRTIIKEICIENVYTPNKIFSINDYDIVVDIGSHIGIFSIYASKLAQKSKIFSFEPTKENFYLLKENIKLNRCKNILPLNFAVSNKNGKIILFLNDEENKGNNTIFKELAKNRDHKTKEIVKTISLDYFCKKYKIKVINFLKIDCEGAEYKILFKCSKKTLKKIQKISMEFHNINEKYNVNVLKNFLEKNGFEVLMKDNYLKENSILYAVRNK